MAFSSRHEPIPSPLLRRVTARSVPFRCWPRKMCLRYPRQKWRLLRSRQSCPAVSRHTWGLVLIEGRGVPKDHPNSAHLGPNAGIDLNWRHKLCHFDATICVAYMICCRRAVHELDIKSEEQNIHHYILVISCYINDFGYPFGIRFCNYSSSEHSVETHNVVQLSLWWQPKQRTLFLKVQVWKTRAETVQRCRARSQLEYCLYSLPRYTMSYIYDHIWL